MSLPRLSFMITDPYGNTVDLHGSNISFSILFISNDWKMITKVWFICQSF
jgi:hypothetical protein